MRRVLCSLSVNPEFAQFALPELKSVLKRLPFPLVSMIEDQLEGVKFDHLYQIRDQHLKNFPYVILKVPNFKQHRKFFEQAAKNTVGINRFVLLISEGKDYKQLYKNKDEGILEEQARKEQKSIICDFVSRNRILDRHDQIERIHQTLTDFKVRGKVTFKDPEVRFQLFENHEWYQGHHKSELTSTLKSVFFGIELSRNKIATAKFNSQYELSKRIYLGPTSTCNDLAFMMCNQGLVSSGSLVYDPFVGTGGLLIPPANMGAIVFGSDLDMRVLNGYSVGRINKQSPYYHKDKKFEVFTPKVNLNFEQYKLPIPNIFRMDCTKANFRRSQMFDAIITDPPYGIRAMSRSVTNKKNEKEQEKIEKKEEEIQKKQEQNVIETAQQKQQNTEEKEQETIQQSLARKQRKQKRKKLKQIKRQKKSNLPQQQKQFQKKTVQKLNRERIDNWDKYDKNKIQSTQRQVMFKGLLDLARGLLKKNGRLVFLYPVFQEEEYQGVKNLPEHQGFQVIDMSQNKISKGNSRILVTLEKN